MPCPTDAAACCRARSRGRRANESGASPAAIAPEDTSTISVPAACASARESTNTRTRSGSIPPAAVVNEDAALVESASHVGTGLDLAALGHRLVDGAPAVCRRTRLGEALVLATAP